MLVLKQNWGNLLNIGKDPGVSRFEFAIGFSVEASAESYITSSNYIEKRSQLLKEIMDRHEIYSNKKPPTLPKKGRKVLILQEKFGNLLNIGRKSKKCRLESGMESSVES